MQNCSVSCLRVLSAPDVRLVWRTPAAHQLAVNVVVLSWCWLRAPAAAYPDRDPGFESAPATCSSSSGASASSNTSNEHALEHVLELDREDENENENEKGIVGGQYLLSGPARATHWRRRLHTNWHNSGALSRRGVEE